jgi:hypothetical protein
MKIYITDKIENSIEGYKTIPILYGKIDMSDIPNNGADQIVALDALNNVPYNLLSDFLEEIYKKMRFGCQLILGGTELNILCKQVLDGQINIKDFNSLVFSKRGIYGSRDIIEVIHHYNLLVDSLIFKGNNYEITITRPVNKN